MEQIQSNRKLYTTIGIVAAVIIIFAVGGVFFLQSKQTKQKVSEEKNVPTISIVPTVDSSVEVDLQYKKNGKDVVLSVTNIPKGTTSIEYELSYQTKDQGLQGILPSEPVSLKSGQSEWEKELQFATCSSGTCIYQEIVGSVKVTLKFNGGYGEKLFEKEFTL